MNTISDNLDLSMGLVSKAIFEKAGKKIQGELYKNKKGFVASGDVFVTKGHALNCVEVYHTVCTSRSGTRAEQVDLISTILRTIFIPETTCNKLLPLDSLRSGLKLFDESCICTPVHFLPSYWYWKPGLS